MLYIFSISSRIQLLYPPNKLHSLFICIIHAHLLCIHLRIPINTLLQLRNTPLHLNLFNRIPALIQLKYKSRMFPIPNIIPIITINNKCHNFFTSVNNYNVIISIMYTLHVVKEKVINISRNVAFPTRKGIAIHGNAHRENWLGEACLWMRAKISAASQVFILAKNKKILLKIC